jgi:uncharacterized protein YecT (DUF1311 family)
MINRALILGMIVGSVFVASAQDKIESLSCKGNTQYELNVCAAEEFNHVDAELNHVYQQLLRATEGNQLATTKIKLTEQAWIVYRDAYLQAMYPEEDKQAHYGSIYPMEAMMFKTKLTRKQIAALSDLLRQYSELEQPAAREKAPPKRK